MPQIQLSDFDFFAFEISPGDVFFYDTINIGVIIITRRMTYLILILLVQTGCSYLSVGVSASVM